MIIFKYLAVGLIWFFSKLPLQCLYKLSWFLKIVFFDIIGYRKKVVKENIKNSFPLLNPAEYQKIEKKFQQNFCDFFVEFIKIRSITFKMLEKRVHFKNFNLLEQYYNEGKSAIVCIGHCGNWEWMAMYLAMICKFEVYAVVKPLNDKFFNQYINGLRSRFIPNRIIPFLLTYKYMVKNKHKQTLTIIASDQTPTKNEIEYWTNFLNQETPVFLGIEKIAKSLDFPVLFFDIQRIKRGYYEIEISELCKEPKQTAPFEITEMHVRKLESAINQHPDNWLWSHRRWKHKKNT